MGLNGEMPGQLSHYYPSLTREEKTRMHPCKRAKCVMTSADSSPTLQSSVSSTQYPELPDEPRPGKIRPSMPTPRVGAYSSVSSLGDFSASNNNGNNNNSSSNHSNQSDHSSESNRNSDIPESETIEEAVRIVRSTLPSPSPRPTLIAEPNSFKSSSLKIDINDKVDGNIKFKAIQRDVDEDSCFLKCVYFTQQCCECTII